jgi:transposase InsO family protein
MSHEDSVTKIKLCYSMYQNGISPEAIYPQLGVHRATMYRWLRGIKRNGVRGFIRQYQHAKKGRRRRKTHGFLKARILRIRREYKNCCGEKIQYILARDYNTHIAVSTIYRILNSRFHLRSKWKKYSKRGYVQKGTCKGDAIQVDTVDCGGLYLFTSIDTYTRETSVVVQTDMTALSGRASLTRQLRQLGPIQHIQRDGGSEFKREWSRYAERHIPSIRTARPYKKNEQAFIERFNGILRKECVGYHRYKKRDKKKLQLKIDEYLQYYHTKRPHMSLNMLTPKEFSTMSHLT